MSKPAYNALEVNGRSVSIRQGAKQSLANVDAVIFDCDGVLIDIRESYNVAIHKTVEYILSTILGDVDGPITTDAQIEALRLCGGFNNDWDTAYVLSEWAFLNIPEECVGRFSEEMLNLEMDGPLADLVNLLSNRLKVGKCRASFQNSQKEFLEMLKGVVKAKKQLDRYDVDAMMDEAAAKKGMTKQLQQFRRLLGYPGRFGECLLVTVFEELYYGAEGVEILYGKKPSFFSGPGLFNKERPIVEEETLMKLQRILGYSNFTIASGRDRWSAKKVLGKLFEYFNQRAAVFLADEVRLIGTEAQKVGKPDPYCLFKSVSYLLPDRNVLYVGDSAEDMLVTKNANEIMNRFLFAGVYASCSTPDLKVEYFMENGADVIMPTVNELPELLLYAKGC
ncbi:MAG: hypothetical protein B9J98_06210 [Candidatus Terraquivivens tikiterensis]|uniref:HAD family hydrolase n=1 Tax=Candidatus Terraquivivens tikiterensis TaxID=1980982 RepID=A0A2R7Y1S0_9ARCH|nr:MAG: hypothetical protein B9J98_06210 [Candidatus Terraquivivens tikiterensis]